MVTVSAPSVPAFVFFLKSNEATTLQPCYDVKFFFLTHCLIYKKLNSFVYKFVVNSQFF